eukprot:SAG22_NODE_710_length_7741_cov_108.460089_10_plen_64_part_00
MPYRVEAQDEERPPDPGNQAADDYGQAGQRGKERKERKGTTVLDSTIRVKARRKGGSALLLTV